MNNIIKAENLSKDFFGPAGTRIKILKDIFFSIDSDNGENKIYSIVAPFGAGKSTLLKILSGIEKHDSGSFTINISDNKKMNRGVYIPSKPSSFPWFNVKENIEFAGKKFLKSSEEIKELISLVGLNGYEDHSPDNRSLGFRFRIALARAMAVNPSIIFLDEPFNKMNQLTKKEIYELLLHLTHKISCSYLLASSNISEAILLSDKIFLMKKDPGEIFDSVEINFKSERNLSLIGNEEFLQYKRLIEKKYLIAGVDKLLSLSF